ncbi:CheY-like receiver and methylesterase domain-containing chemotaxis response regulator [Desulfocapsa sulfexigens DSM 10523]|uniref:protein-glutamate methylesterase n=1 Tax=Desulfocapsa sulfexigens (strain DSM 10523 / SB164P1) TaxID=1167006 RepID=M1NIE5_DESSD|nr:chemotaxis protein CheB [Desulfocapsa sulfexigens]AGF79344.1 CheY-like receiver and methylesterase domain-containing chemotaxis response regulator [Desulfocapsa sulfexigens DSM 10523]
MSTSEHLQNPVKVLIVDDSWVLRRVLRGTLAKRDDVSVAGEATNGIEALEMILKLQPDVILLDMEMPVMDGMTTLQHLMIHTPTPTIMLSSLSKKGTARCFDALKYGAVDFVSKNSFFQGMDSTAHSKLVLNKIFAAAKTSVQSIDPMHQKDESGVVGKLREKVVFCEDCGTRQSVKAWPLNDDVIKCQKCGDDIPVLMNKRYRRMNFITVIGAGEGGYANLLKMIPALSPEMGGAICVMVLDDRNRVQSFVKYLDAISDFDVLLGKNGTTLEGGCCYLFSGAEQVLLSPYSGNYSFKIQPTANTDSSARIDELMASAGTLLKDRVAGVLLSGEESDGSRGIEKILAEGGNCFVLNPDHCFHKTMTSGPFVRFNLQGGLNETLLAAKIQECHFAKKENVITA